MSHSREEMIPLKEERDSASPVHHGKSQYRSKFAATLIAIAFLVLVAFCGGLFAGYGALCPRRHTSSTADCTQPGGTVWGEQVQMEPGERARLWRSG